MKLSNPNKAKRRKRRMHPCHFLRFWCFTDPTEPDWVIGGMLWRCGECNGQIHKVYVGRN